MKVLLVMLASLLATTLIYGQIQSPINCSDLLNEVSMGWKQDSLANNNYRFKNYERIVNCQIDTLGIQYLIEKLGRPNQIKETNHSLEYWYYVRDDKTIAKERPFECLFISFNFNHKRQLVAVTDGLLDY